ncbi:MAG TPA: rhodanese-like domain-containing protein [Variovorax sp.]|nr:rhodanese-like domain-containing protein [Variovorax sp.]
MNALMQDDSTRMEPAMALALAANFGSVAHWRQSFIGLGRAFGGGAGCLALVFLPEAGALAHRWAADAAHVTGGGVLLLLLATFDEAHPQGLEDFVERIDWAHVYERYQEAVHAASEAFGATQDEAAQAPIVLDVRRAGVFAGAKAMLPGARWCDPAAVADWAAELPPGREVLVYCVYGHEVGRATALRLRALGVPARFLVGGFDAWQAAGRALQARPGAPS